MKFNLIISNYIFNNAWYYEIVNEFESNIIICEKMKNKSFFRFCSQMIETYQ
jgi:hypothetical protein